MAQVSPTARQLDLLRFVAGFQLAHSRTPKLREIADGLGCVTKSNVVRLIDLLVERELIQRVGGDLRLLIDVPVPAAPDGAPLFAVQLHPRGRKREKADG